MYLQSLVDKDLAIIKWEHLTQSQFSPTLRNAAKNEKVLFLHTSKKVVKKHSANEFFSWEHFVSNIRHINGQNDTQVGGS